jgi:nitrate/nitrite transporter NarK
MLTQVRAAAAPPRATRVAVRGWLVAVVVYLLAVLHRTSLGVAGLLAQHRFGITPAQLSVFVVMQLGLYAAMQIPAGVLVDRYGPRRLLITASLVMGTAQLLFAFVPSYPAALAARALLGCGDALTFISVLRYAAGHFSPRRFPLLVALTAMAGTLGNVVATLPLAILLHSLGWTVSFGGAALLSLFAAVGVYALMDDAAPHVAPLRSLAEVGAGISNVNRRVRAAWGLPGTRLGFWVHAACMSTPTAFGVLWAGPYLVKGAHFSITGAAEVLMASVIVSALASPLFGALIGRRPSLRVPLGLAVCAATIVGWLALIIFGSDAPPQPFVALLFVVMALGGPASMAAFALARDYNRASTLGTASGVVNVGGFATTIVIAVGFGWTLGTLGGTTAHNLRVAALVAVAVQLAASARMVVWYRRVRAFVLDRQALGEQVPVPVVRRRWDLAA